MVQTHENLPLIAESDHIAKEASSEFNEINKEASSSESSEPIINDEKMNHKVNYMKWLKIAFYVIILLIGQTAANLLGRLYFEKGGVLGLPIVPVAAVIVFHDNMSKLKGASMALAIGGFIAYVYQQYVDDFKSKKDSKSSL
ncbi:hypothetical protein IC575_029067 [Cucumis melo]|uniref:Probable purine permease 7 isoform X3 n=1 Tax=Cucumis melo TaxID=3656 RepID=A0A1S3B9X3_CUCME|nr:probable purine permease 7 isoform X3 [Cucumis melo]